MQDCARALKNKFSFRLFTAVTLALFVWGCSAVKPPAFQQPRVWSIGAVDYIYLEDILVQYQIQYQFDPAAKQSVLMKDGYELRFQIDERMIELNGELYELLFPPLYVNGYILLPESLAYSRWWSGTWTETAARRVLQNRDRNFLRVIIDAGHGGRDIGAQSGGVQEKDVTLGVAMKLKNRLEAVGHQVIMTRTRDQYLALPDRTWIANTTSADLLISLHCNSAQNENASGMEIYYARNAYAMEAQAPNVPMSQLDYKKQPNEALRHHPDLIRSPAPESQNHAAVLAGFLEEGFGSFPVPGVQRGIKQADFFVLNGTSSPALLIEMGFLTNAKEREHLRDPLYQDFLADWVYQGIKRYNREVFY